MKYNFILEITILVGGGIILVYKMSLTVNMKKMILKNNSDFFSENKYELCQCKFVLKFIRRCERGVG